MKFVGVFDKFIGLRVPEPVEGPNIKIKYYGTL